ncbi:MAG: cytochrome c biogenesis protein ResB [Deltaproteobacteria bacterium]|nr:cytochrome c biogenesis protein ResB [Deltaproteobacteria bacterium]
MNFIGKIWSFFASTALSVVLMALICVDAIYGSVLVVANRPFFEILDREILMPWLVYEGPKHLSLTLWIYVLIALMFFFAVNTAVCTADRFYSIWKNKRPWQSLLPHVVHAGFLIALLGHLIGGLYGIRSYDNAVFEGEKTPLRNAPGLSVRLDSTETDYGPRGMPSRIATTITVFEGETEVKSATASVNSPVLHGLTAFHHADSGETVSGLLMDVSGETLSVPFGSSFKVKDGRTLWLSRVFPDFAMEADGTPYSRSREMRNPHAEILMPDSKRGYLPLSAPGSAIRAGGFTIELRDYVRTEYAIINVVKDPGIVLIGLGSLVLSVGMVLLLVAGVNRGELIGR